MGENKYSQRDLSVGDSPRFPSPHYNRTPASSQRRPLVRFLGLGDYGQASKSPEAWLMAVARRKMIDAAQKVVHRQLQVVRSIPLIEFRAIGLVGHLRSNHEISFVRFHTSSSSEKAVLGCCRYGDAICAHTATRGLARCGGDQPLEPLVAGAPHQRSVAGRCTRVARCQSDAPHTPFCHGDPGEIGRSRMPMGREPSPDAIFGKHRTIPCLFYSFNF
jgi:hypothetical protein